MGKELLESKIESELNWSVKLELSLFKFIDARNGLRPCGPGLFIRVIYFICFRLVLG